MIALNDPSVPRTLPLLMYRDAHPLYDGGGSVLRCAAFLDGDMSAPPSSIHPAILLALRYLSDRVCVSQGALLCPYCSELCYAAMFAARGTNGAEVSPAWVDAAQAIVDQIEPTFLAFYGYSRPPVFPADLDIDQVVLWGVRQLDTVGGTRAQMLALIRAIAAVTGQSILTPDPTALRKWTEMCSPVIPTVATAMDRDWSLSSEEIRATLTDAKGLSS